MTELNKKTKILFAGDSLSDFSGLAYVASSIMLNFIKATTNEGHPKYEVAYATLCGGDSEKKNFHIHGKEFEHYASKIPIYNCQATSENSGNKFNLAVSEFKPDIVFSNVDPWYIDPVIACSHRDFFYYINYTTIETPYYPDNVMFPTNVLPHIRKSMKDLLSNVDMLLPVTSVGTKALINMGLKNVSKQHVYNGLDFDRRCKQDIVPKTEVFGSKVNDDDFIFMTLGTNSERKKLDVVLEAFSKFLKKMNWNKKYKLYIHTDLDSRIGGTDLVTQIMSLGINEHVFAPRSFKEKKLMPKDDLYKRYKASDCYIGLPAGEGFGYGFAEALMHKKPVIYLDYGGPSDYLKDIGLPVKVKELYYARNVCMKWALADQDDAVKQMCRIASDEKLREKLSKAGFDKAKELYWGNIFQQLEQVVMSGYSNFKKSELFDFNLKKIV